MPTPVEISWIETLPGKPIVERLGGIWRNRPWSMSAANMIAELETPADRRQWDFHVIVRGQNTPVTVLVEGDRKHLVLADRGALLALPRRPAWPAAIE
jgi:hypothetical protein